MAFGGGADPAWFACKTNLPPGHTRGASPMPVSGKPIAQGLAGEHLHVPLPRSSTGAGGSEGCCLRNQEEWSVMSIFRAVCKSGA